MMRRFAAAWAVLLIAACGVGGDAPEREERVARRTVEPAIIPAPLRLERRRGTYFLSETFTIEPGDASEAGRIAAYFDDLMERASGFDPNVIDSNTLSGGAVRFRIDHASSLGEESYRLEISKTGVDISASSPAGLFYGAVTLWQVLTSDPAHSFTGESSPGVRLPYLVIEDAPRFSWRGLMLDSARHYQSPDFIKDFIDWMALHKLNTLHWHLTDDQGWRLEIKKYPKLTEIGAWRVPAGAGPAADIDAQTGAPRLYGGYYTQDEVRDIVAYAAERFVTIVPEIEMPGHAQATIVAYPELGVDGARPEAVSSDWGVFPYVFNAEEETFDFLEDVLTEVTALFPSVYVHIGGDEAQKEQWENSPRIQERMAELNVTSEDALQGYFTQRMDAFLTARDRRLVGWDEILEGGLSENATVMSWRGVEGGVAATAAGHDAVIAAWPLLYLDNRQGASGGEPPGRGRIVSLKAVYDFDPHLDGLGDAARIRGVQANIWTEHIRTSDRVEWMAFPRAAALAEIAWSPPEAKDWDDFLKRLAPMLQRYKALGVNYATSAFSPAIEAETASLKAGSVSLSLSNQTGFGEIHYTLNGSTPDAAAPVFEKPFAARMPAIVSAATFYDGVQMSPAARRIIDADSFLARDDTELKTCADKLVLFLEDDAPVEGPRATFLIDIMEPCWVFKGAPLDGATAIEARVGQVPFNFQVGADREKITFRAPKTPAGELEARLDGCDGALIASLPLAPAVDNPATTILNGALAPVSGVHDVCITFTADGVDLLWALDHVRFIKE